MNVRALAALGSLAVAAAGCTVDRDVRLVIEGSRPGVVYELRVYDAPACDAALTRIGLEDATADGSVHAQTFTAGNGRAVGALLPRPHCFAVLARTTSCVAVAYGETVADLASTDLVTIRLNDVSVAAGCNPPRTCTAGVCAGGTVACTAPDECTTPEGGRGDCCGGRCVFPSSDPLNCGACGVACTDAVGGGAWCCNGSCVDLMSDPAHCGACNAACTGATCRDGVCGGMAPADLQIGLEGMGAFLDLVVEVVWFQWDGRDPDPPTSVGYGTSVIGDFSGEPVRIPIAEIRPPDESLYLCERGCFDELMCLCADPGMGVASAAFAYVEATDGTTLVGRAPVIVLHIPSPDVTVDPSFDALGVTFTAVPPIGTSVWEVIDGATTLAPLDLATVVHMTVCDPTVPDECTREPVVRPYP